MVTSFRYLGRVILVAENNWPEVARNLSRTSSMWKRMRILVILFHMDLVRDKFLATSGQSFSATKITLPRYRKEVTISRG